MSERKPKTALQGFSSLVAGVFLLTNGYAFATELPKEFDFSHTLFATIDSDHWTEIEFDGVGKAWTGQWTHIALDDGAGFRHNTTGHCMGTGYHRSDGGVEGHGFCYSVDSDGDKVFERWELTGEGVGKGTYFGGTGKYNGIMCSHVFERVSMPTPSAEGVFQLIAKEFGTCTLP